jgi:RNA recognition motif-containing protein
MVLNGVSSHVRRKRSRSNGFGFVRRSDFLSATTAGSETGK